MGPGLVRAPRLLVQGSCTVPSGFSKSCPTPLINNKSSSYPKCGVSCGDSDWPVDSLIKPPSPPACWALSKEPYLTASCPFYCNLLEASRVSLFKHVNPITLPPLAINQKTSSRVPWGPTGGSPNPLCWPTRSIVVWPLVSILFPSLQSMWVAHSWKSACSLPHTVPAA